MVAVSSTWVSDPQPGWSAYTAVEGLVRTAAVEHRGGGRTPRLRTAYDATPMGVRSAEAVEPYAAVVVRSLMAEASPGSVRVRCCLKSAVEPSRVEKARSTRTGE